MQIEKLDNMIVYLEAPSSDCTALEQQIQPEHINKQTKYRIPRLRTRGMIDYICSLHIRGR